MADRPTVLVPVRVLSGESIPEGVPALLANAHVVLLGYHEIPEQTAPGQAQLQFEDRARERLADFEELFTAAGATVDPRLVFTQEPQKTINRQIYEHEAIAVLAPEAVPTVEEVLVPIRGAVGVDRIVQVVAGLFADTDATVVLFHHAGENETDEDAATFLAGVADSLAAAGVSETAIETRIERDGSPQDAIVAASESADVVVVGESDPTIATYVFGLPADQIADRFLGPVIVVQRALPDDAEH